MVDSGTTTLVDSCLNRSSKCSCGWPDAYSPKIAAELNLSTSTVGTHLYNIKQKLQAGNQAERSSAPRRADRALTAPPPPPPTI